MPRSSAEDSHLHSLLWRWAARFTPAPAMQKMLVEQTLQTALELIPLDGDDTPVDQAMLSIMRRIVLEKLGSPRPNKNEMKGSRDKP